MAIPDTLAAGLAVILAQRELLAHVRHFEQQAKELRRYLESVVAGETTLTEKADSVGYAIHHLTCGNTSRRVDLLAKAMCEMRVAAAAAQAKG